MHALLARLHPSPRQPAGAARPPLAEPPQSTIPARFDGGRESGDRARRVRRPQTRRGRPPRNRNGRGGSTGYLIVIVALFVLLWLLVLRPQRRRQTEQLRMQDTLQLGNEVITAGGIRGYVRQLDEEVLKVEIAPDVVVRLDRRAVAAVVRDEPEELEPLAQGERSES
ncbi:MAG: preprotein translocase subunit YajC [Actinobacteria bacterium]|nr:MAG: preprotein translocase subunit YajC [Actinomycetota bacterium]